MNWKGCKSIRLGYWKKFTDANIILFKNNENLILNYLQQQHKLPTIENIIWLLSFFSLWIHWYSMRYYSRKNLIYVTTLLAITPKCFLWLLWRMDLCYRHNDGKYQDCEGMSRINSIPTFSVLLLRYRTFNCIEKYRKYN